MKMMILDPRATALSTKIGRQTGRRASELYPYVLALHRNGVSDTEIEYTLGGLCEIGPSWTLQELLAMAFGEEWDADDQRSQMVQRGRDGG